MADIGSRPTIGQKPWDLWPAISAVNDQVTDLSGAVNTLSGAIEVTNTNVSDIRPRSNNRAVGQGELLLSVKDHNAKGDGVTDDREAIQSVIDSVATSGGGVILLPNGVYRISAPLILKNGVTLSSLRHAFGYAPGGIKGVSIEPTNNFPAGSYLLDTPAGGVTSSAVVGIDLIGRGISLGGLRKRAGSWNQFKNIHFNGFLGSAAVVDAGFADTFEDWLVINSYTQTATGEIGVIDIAGADHFLNRIEVSGSMSVISSANLYKAAIIIRGTNFFCSNLVGEFADKGIVVKGDKNRFTSCRADRNMAMGWHVYGGGNLFATCHAIENHKSTNTPTWAAWQTDGLGNSYTACSSTLGGNQYTWGMVDTVNTSDPLARTYYDPSCRWEKGSLGAYSGVGFLGSASPVPNNPIRPNSGTTIDVSNSSLVVPQYSTPVNITDFTGGRTGQVLYVIGNPNVTLVNSTTIRTSTAANKTLASNVFYEFVFYNNSWFEKA